MKKTHIIKLTPDANVGLKKLKKDANKAYKWTKEKYKQKTIQVQPDRDTMEMLEGMGAKISQTISFKTKWNAEKYAKKFMKKGYKVKVYKDKYSTEEYPWSVDIEK